MEMYTSQISLMLKVKAQVDFDWSPVMCKARLDNLLLTFYTYSVEPDVLLLWARLIYGHLTAELIVLNQKLQMPVDGQQTLIV